MHYAFFLKINACVGVMQNTAGKEGACLPN